MDTKFWYVIRVTRNRTDAVFDDISSLAWKDIDIYYPHNKKSIFSIHNRNIKQTTVPTTPILPGIIFVMATEKRFIELLNEGIPGLTPYYDHFHTNKQGTNPYLIVPERQFNNFRRYCDIQDDHKLIDPKDMPDFLNGKKVRIISGSFAGVEGTMLRWHSMRRVFIDLGQLGKFGTGFIRACDIELIDNTSSSQ